MIDCHNHILPGLDDGSPDIATSLAMLRAMREEGVLAVVATPHVIGGGAYEHSGARIEEARKILAEAARQEGLGIAILAGAENYISPDLPARLEADARLLFPGGQAVLFELPMQEVPLYAAAAIGEIAARGIIPVIAHPERNAAVISRPALLEGLLARGAVLQVNAGSILGWYGRDVARVARLLLERDHVFLLASDAHGAGEAMPSLGEAVKAATVWLGEEERVQRLVTTNPSRIVRITEGH